MGVATRCRRQTAFREIETPAAGRRVLTLAVCGLGARWARWGPTRPASTDRSGKARCARATRAYPPFFRTADTTLLVGGTIVDTPLSHADGIESRGATCFGGGRGQPAATQPRSDNKRGVHQMVGEKKPRPVWVGCYAATRRDAGLLLYSFDVLGDADARLCRLCPGETARRRGPASQTRQMGLGGADGVCPTTARPGGRLPPSGRSYPETAHSSRSSTGEVLW